MKWKLVLIALPTVVLFGVVPAAAQGVDNSKQVADIERRCGLKKGTITANGDQIQLQPSRDEAYDKVGCALERLKKAGIVKLGFVGNEADPDAAVDPALHYIAEGTSTEIGALLKAAQTDNWVINKTAMASDGMTIIQFESSATMTNGQANKLLDRIWKMEFGDIGFGTAPRKLSDPDLYGE